MFSSIKKLITDSKEFNSLQESLAQFVSQVSKIPFLDGVLIESVALDTSLVRLEHRLGKKAKGYFVVKRDQDEIVYDGEGSNSNKDKFLNLYASGPVTVTLWVF